MRLLPCLLAAVLVLLSTIAGCDGVALARRANLAQLGGLRAELEVAAAVEDEVSVHDPQPPLTMTPMFEKKNIPRHIVRLAMLGNAATQAPAKTAVAPTTAVPITEAPAQTAVPTVAAAASDAHANDNGDSESDQDSDDDVAAATKLAASAPTSSSSQVDGGDDAAGDDA